MRRACCSLSAASARLHPWPRSFQAQGLVQCTAQLQLKQRRNRTRQHLASGQTFNRKLLPRPEPATQMTVHHRCHRPRRNRPRRGLPASGCLLRERERRLRSLKGPGHRGPHLRLLPTAHRRRHHQYSRVDQRVVDHPGACRAICTSRGDGPDCHRTNPRRDRRPHHSTVEFEFGYAI